MIVCEGKRSDDKMIVCVREGRRREGRRAGRTGERAESGGMAAKKLEPHTEMWGKNTMFLSAGVQLVSIFVNLTMYYKKCPNP